MRILILVLLAMLAITILVVAGKLLKINKANKEMAIVAQDKLREERLDMSIINDLDPQVVRPQKQAKPFMEEYDAKKTFGRNGRLMIQIIESKELSSRKYMFDSEQGINIGSNASQNNIVVSEQGISDMQCSIFSRDGVVVVRNIGDAGKVILTRKKNRVFVERIPIEVKNGDIIEIGRTEYKIVFIKA